MGKRILVTLVLMFITSLGLTAGESSPISLPSTEWGAPEGKACIECHLDLSPSLVKQWRLGAMGQAGVNCYDCHKAEKDEPDAMDHEDFTIALLVTPKDCGRCHAKEVKEMTESHHAKAGQILNTLDNYLGEVVGGPAAVAVGCRQCHGSKIEVLENGANLIDTGLLDISKNLGIKKILVDTAAMAPGDNSGASIAAIPVIKEEYGLPTGCAIHNVVEKSKWLNDFNGAKKPVDAAGV